MMRFLSRSVFALVFCIHFSQSARARDDSQGHERFTIRTLSTSPDRVSGADILIEIAFPSSQSLQSLIVSLNGRNVSSSFRAGRTPNTAVGLVTGLSLGRNTLTVEGKGRSPPSESLALTNFPLTGPIFSGPHQVPFICETQTFVLPVTGGNLGPPLDSDCSTATRINYVYRSTDGTLKPLPNPSVHPADLAQTTTSQGVTVNYIVRIETGTINRAIYQIAILHDPAADPFPIPGRARLAGTGGYSTAMAVAPRQATTRGERPAASSPARAAATCWRWATRWRRRR